MRPEEIALILEAGAKHGVAEMRLPGLFVRYGQPAVREDSPPPKPPLSAPTSSDLTTDQHEAQNKESVERDQLVLREEQLAEFLVTDPLRYEEMIRDGELGDEPATRDNGSGVTDDPGEDA